MSQDKRRTYGLFVVGGYTVGLTIGLPEGTKQSLTRSVSLKTMSPLYLRTETPRGGSRVSRGHYDSPDET